MEQGVEQGSGAAAPAEPDYIAELQRLAQFRDQGIITVEAFEAKMQLLGI